MSHFAKLFWVFRLCALTIASLWIPHSALAWGNVGHRAIGTLAQGQLTPTALPKIKVLLAQEPGSDLASISTWADEHKNPTTARWHYLNFPRGSCVYNRARDCPDGNCLVEALAGQLEILRSDAGDVQKLQALKYVVHLVGDLHQPLHLGYLDDKGGNLYQIQAYKKGSNLHSLWDSGLIGYLSNDPAVWATRLASTPLPQRFNTVDSIRIAEESCRIVGTQGFYPDRKVETDYVQRWTPVTEQQLQLGGARLAQLLNDAFR